MLRCIVLCSVFFNALPLSPLSHSRACAAENLCILGNYYRNYRNFAKANNLLDPQKVSCRFRRAPLPALLDMPCSPSLTPPGTTQLRAMDSAMQRICITVLQSKVGSIDPLSRSYPWLLSRSPVTSVSLSRDLCLLLSPVPRTDGSTAAHAAGGEEH